VVDSLLNEALQTKGINTEYEFAVKISNPDSIIFLKRTSNSDNFNDPLFQAKLFPEEQFSNPNFLLVNFPNQKKYIIESVGLLLGISIILILVIIAVFYRTVRMLIHQKKITEIKNDLINNITHEFKTPISTISLACESLNEPELVKNKSAVKRYSSMIREENNRLSFMVENLLTTAAIEKGDYNLNKTKSDINQLITTVAETFDKTINEIDGKLELSLSPNLPDINADSFHIKNIVSNLIDNAIKYSEKQPDIKIETLSTANGIIIKISDSGIGIESKYFKKIFDTFYRIPTGNIHNVKGHGVGLSYVKKMVEAHDGNISVENLQSTKQSRKVTLFTIFLPYNDK
jgi:two-component system phosphate regulon sensor histidine kinase PhoR